MKTKSTTVDVKIAGAAIPALMWTLNCYGQRPAISTVGLQNGSLSSWRDGRICSATRLCATPVDPFAALRNVGVR
jgi:hypothetical protein